MARVKLDPDERIRCHVCGAEIKRKSQYTHRKSEPCLVARDMALACKLGWLPFHGLSLPEICNAAGIQWKRLRTSYSPQGWGRKASTSYATFCPSWAVAVMTVGYANGWQKDSLVKALVVLNSDTEAQDSIVSAKLIDDMGANSGHRAANSGNRGYDATFPLLSHYLNTGCLAFLAAAE